MNKFWKGLGVCTFLCMMTAAPSWADICFLPTGACEQGSQAKVAESKSCQDYIDEGTYYGEEQEDMNCSLANVPGCTLYECTAKSCEERGFKIPGTSSEDDYPVTFSKEAFTCTPCKQGGKYFWKCEPKPCVDPYFTQDDAENQCGDGEIWAPADGAGMSGRAECGHCVIEQCPEGTISEDELPTEGCCTCSSVLRLETGRYCYKCEQSKEYVTAAAVSEMESGCFTFTSKPFSTGETCYLPAPMECPPNQYVAREERGEGKVQCTCENYEYEFTAGGEDVINEGPLTDDGHNTHDSKILHYTAAGGVKKINVVSTQTGEETIVWPYDAPTSSGECTVEKSGDGALLKVICQSNLTTEEKGSSFTITQIEADNISTHTIDIKIIIDPDTCENPNEGDAACGNKAGWASYKNGPRPTCYKTSLEAVCSANGYVPFDSGHKSIAGQACYYCINDNCPTAEFIKDKTPAPAEGYLTETTDMGSNCYKERPCPDGYKTQYPDINACTKNGHPEGWSYTSDGLCGAIPCGKCTTNKCSGAGFDKKCEAQPRCADENAPSCGYKDLNTPSSVEYEGDTPKYNANIKQCPEGTSTTQKQGCGTNVDSGYRSGEQVCWKYNEPDRNCSTGFTYDESKCSCQPIQCPDGTSTEQKVGCGTNVDSGHRSGTAVCWTYNEPDRNCSSPLSWDETQCKCTCQISCAKGQKLDPDTCTCKGCPEDDPSCGWIGDDCTSDADCKESTDFPLYCFNGKCAECDVYSTCEMFMTDSSRFKNKYGSSTKSIKLSARDSNNVRVRYAGREANITDLQAGYRNRFYCTGHGECSACKNKDGDGLCSYFDNNKRKQVHYICDSNKKGAPCYEAVNDKKTKTLLFYHW